MKIIYKIYFYLFIKNKIILKLLQLKIIIVVFFIFFYFFLCDFLHFIYEKIKYVLS
jgi:hypothetical protein